MNTINYKKQQGFSILAVILVIVAITVAIGIWALSGQTNTSNSSNSSADIQASSISNDAMSIKLAFDTLILNGATPNSIVFIPNTTSTSGAANILDPLNGIQAPKPNSNAIRSNATIPEGIWVYTAYLGLPQIGSGLGHIGILLAGIKDSVCKRINYNLYGSDTIINIGITGSDIVQGATASNPTNTVVITLPPTTQDKTEACVGNTTIPDSNFYYKVLKIN